MASYDSYGCSAFSTNRHFRFLHLIWAYLLAVGWVFHDSAHSEWRKRNDVVIKLVLSGRRRGAIRKWAIAQSVVLNYYRVYKRFRFPNLFRKVFKSIGDDKTIQHRATRGKSVLNRATEAKTP